MLNLLRCDFYIIMKTLESGKHSSLSLAENRTANFAQYFLKPIGGSTENVIKIKLSKKEGKSKIAIFIKYQNIKLLNK